MCVPCRRTSYFYNLCRIKTYAFVGRILHLIPIRSLRLAPCDNLGDVFAMFYAMSEQHVCLLHNAGQKLAICFTPCLIVACPFFLSLDHWFDVWLGLGKRTPQQKALFDNGGAFRFFCLFLLVFAHFSGL